MIHQIGALLLNLIFIFVKYFILKVKDYDNR